MTGDYTDHNSFCTQLTTPPWLSNSTLFPEYSSLESFLEKAEISQIFLKKNLNRSFSRIISLFHTFLCFLKNFGVRYNESITAIKGE
jgi:hypothetical protein